MLICVKTRRSEAVLFSVLTLLAIASVLMYAGCSPACKMGITAIEQQRFNEIVPMAELQDSLSAGALVPGMPYITVCSLLAPGCQGTIRKQVAGIGSRAEVYESEGIARKYADPRIEFYLDEYKTDCGKIAVWMQRPDFYRLTVAVWDSVWLYWRNESGDTIVREAAEIKYLETALRLVLLDTLRNIPGNARVDCEIRHRDNPLRTRSFWYGLQLMREGEIQRLTIPSTGRDYLTYPIDWLELDREPVESFRWRKEP